MLHQAVFSTSELCHALGVRHAVLSPGSRNAPLTISFARNEKIKKWIIPDERTAGFIALGIAQESKTPVVLCCTSGTALLNYAPAIAEAYYREIPLIVLSADRPIELIDQRDGQTIRQFGALKNHVKNSYQLPPVHNGTASEYLNKLAEGIRFSGELPKGPVHFNIPFKEPFYPEENQELEFIQINLNTPKAESFPKENLDFTPFKKILILVGQQDADAELSEQLESLSCRIPVICSPLNNLKVQGIKHADLFLNNQEDLKPDLLITNGLSVLSKKLKNYIRSHKPKEHWHFDPAGVKVDTYNTSPRLIRSSLLDFFSSLSEVELDIDFYKSWVEKDSEAAMKLSECVADSSFSELVAFSQIFSSIPSDSNVHFGNSMPIRYADIFGVGKGFESFCNRGTSGIEGVTSTALGATLVSKKLNILLTGDLSFLYDRNAFFHNHDYSNLRIIVFNNQGGGIFGLIDGPRNLPELEEYFETRHNRTAEFICAENKIEYQKISGLKELEKSLRGFYSKAEFPRLIEVFTEPEVNRKAYKNLRGAFA